MLESADQRVSAPTCRMCESSAVRRIFVKDSIPYFSCQSCRFVFSVPATNANFQEDLSDYEPAYLDYLGASDEDSENMAGLLRWANRFGAVARGRVLDVGSGSGKFVHYLRDQGADAHGLEPARPLFERYLEPHGYFSNDTIESYAAAHGREFDFLFACDVIEHVERPDVFLASAAKLLRGSGILFVSTPDVGSLTARLSGRWWHYYNKYHLSYLSRQTINALAVRYGLEEAGFDRLPRIKSLRYLFQYLNDFVAGASGSKLPEWISDSAIPINLQDTMYLAFRFSSSSERP